MPSLAYLLELFAWTAISEAVPNPACQSSAAPSQTVLSQVRTTSISVPPTPFGIVYATQQKDIAFVALSSNNTLGVLNTSSFAPTLSHQIALPVTGAAIAGINITPDGEHVFITGGTGAVIVDAAKAAAGDSSAVVGTLNGGAQTTGEGAIEVSFSADSKFAFVSNEYGRGGTTNTPGLVDVFALQAPSSNGSVAGKAVGTLSLGYEVVGTALSPDGATMYATSEQKSPATMAGFVSVIDVKTLETKPGPAAIRANVSAGCNPVRTIVSKDGKTVWVTARASNSLLAFDAQKLETAPNNALLVSVQVGTLPVGLTFARNETRIVTADSNRENIPGAVAGLTVVDVQKALDGKNASLGSIPTGLFPREIAMSPDGNTILVTDYESAQVQAIDVATLP